MLLQKSILIGLGSLGVSTVQNTEQRLKNIRFGEVKLLSETDASGNPIRFCGIDDGNTIDGNNFLENFSKVKGIQPNFFLVENHSEFIQLLKNEIISLSQIQSDIFQKRLCTDTISISSRPTKLIFIADLVELQNEDIAGIFNETVKLDNDTEKTLICYGSRSKKNGEYLKSIEDYFDSIYLSNGESPKIITSIRDKINLLTNFVSAYSLNFDYFQYNDVVNKYFVFGASNISFPFDRLSFDAAYKLLKYFNSADETFGKEFKNSFIGQTKKIKAGEPEEPFSLGIYESEKSEVAEEISDEYFPLIPNHIEVRAEELKTGFLTWLDEHAERMKADFQKELLIKRIGELVKPSNFIKIALELWSHNFEAIDFLLGYEIMQKAKERARVLINEFTGRINKRLDDFHNDISDKIFPRSNIEHNGSLAWESSRKIIREIIDIKLSFFEQEIKSLERTNTESFKKEKLFSVMDKLPTPFSFLSRIIILGSIFLFFWNGAYNFVFNNQFYVPSWIAGSLILLFVLLGMYWFGFRKKIKELYSLLVEYMNDKVQTKEDEIKRAEIELVKDLYLRAAKSLKDKYSTKPEFFFKMNSAEYQVDKNSNFLVSFHNTENINPEFLTLTEKYYYNRFLTYNYLQNKLDEYLNIFDELHNGFISKDIFIAVDSEPDTIVSELIGEVHNEITIRKEISNIFNPENELASKFWEISDNITETLTTYSDYILKYFYEEFKKLLGKKEEYSDLITFMEQASKKISKLSFSEMIENSKNTFKFHNEDPYSSDYQIFTSSKNIFENSVENEVIDSFDRNTIIFLSWIGPTNNGNIQWLNEDESR